MVLALSGILFVPLAIPGLILGVVAINKIRKIDGSGRRFAIAGIIISAIPIILIGMLILVFFYSVLQGSKLSQRNPHGILKVGRLADLPESATDVKAEGWGALFTGSDYLMFRASSEDIEKFLAESPSIKHATPEIFNPEHMYLPNPVDKEYYTDEELENHYKHEYYFPYNLTPEWYDLTIKVKGRMYEIPGDPDMRGHNWGSVIINDETNTVYINVIWS
jgi:hypothetical protein